MATHTPQQAGRARARKPATDRQFVTAVGRGLAVCERIIRGHGGKIRVKSIPGKGTIFYIRLETVR